MEPAKSIISRLPDTLEAKLFWCCSLTGQWIGQMEDTDICGWECRNRNIILKISEN